MSKISELSDGGALQSTDYLIAVRSGGNVKVQLSELPAGIDTGGNIEFGDNEKAIFGAGSDLQIYHDGSHSYISDQGTGRLYVQGSDAVRLTDASAGNMLSAIAGDGVYAYYNTALKLATTDTGIDVTGTVTADGLTVANTAVVAGDFDGGTAATYIRLQDDTDNFLFGSNNSLGNFLIKNETADALRLSVANTGDISFYEDTGTTPKFFWDASAERLGLGTSSPATALDMLGDLTVRRAAASTQYTQIQSGGGESKIIAKNGAAATYQALIFESGNNATTAERMRIDANGNVGIGTSSPDTLMELRSANPVLTIRDTETSTASNDARLRLAETGVSDALGNYYDIGYIQGALQFRYNTSECMRLDDSGNLGLGVVPGSYDSDYRALQIGTTANFMGAVSGDGNWISNNAIFSDGAWKYIQTAAASSLDMQSTTAPFRFRYAASGTAGNAISWSEAMRIDSSGNVGIGTSSPSDALVVEGDVASPHRIAVSNANASGAETLSFKQGATIKSWVEFDNSTSNFDVWQYTNNALRFGTNNQERMRLDASGNLLVGTTSAGSLSGDAVIGFGANGGIISKQNTSVANAGTVDISINTGGGGYQGFLIVTSTVTANASQRTHATYSVFGRGTDSSIQQIATDNGTTGGATFTVTTPSNGVIRATNTSGNTTAINIQFFGGTSY